MIILLCLIPLHTNLKLVDDYLLLFSKKINKKIVNKTKKEIFNNLEKQEVNSNNIPNKDISPNVKSREVKKNVGNENLPKKPFPEEEANLGEPSEYCVNPIWCRSTKYLLLNLKNCIHSALEVASYNSYSDFNEIDARERRAEEDKELQLEGEKFFKALTKDKKFKDSDHK
jgi:hypothetical protein